MKIKHLSVFLSLLVVFSFFYFQRQAAYAACLQFSDVIHNGSYIVADLNGQIISSCNPDKPFVPASIVKIQTALAAFHILGRDFRFRTAFYADQQNNLYIKGYGDPFLVSEEINIILGRLLEREIKTINGIYVDDSLFDLHGQVPGLGKSDNPYDSPVGALGVNFNTVNFKVTGHGKIISGEPQTPKLPLMKELGKGFREGEYRVNICKEECQQEVQTARYAAELFRELQRRRAIPGDGQVGIREVPESARLIYIHRNTRPLDDVVYSFLKYSNNFVANQVYLVSGAEKFGYPATWQKAEKALREALVDIIGIRAADAIRLEEGSGLSRQNSMTAQAMIQTLLAFRPFMQFMQEKKGANIKSGTLKGVYNYAGYINDGKPFVIMLNQEKNTRDTILKRLQKLSVVN